MSTEIEVGQKRVGSDDYENQSKNQKNEIFDLTENDSSEEEEEDDDADNDVEEERHHTGELEIDYESKEWDDWDENCHGQIDTNSNRRNYSDGFKWSCCDQTGGSKGCIRGVGLSLLEQYPDSSDPELDEEKRHHTGELEVDYESKEWDDWDENCHGQIDTNSNRKEFPDGFKWSCCDQTGTYAEGCTINNESDDE